MRRQALKLIEQRHVLEHLSNPLGFLQGLSSFDEPMRQRFEAARDGGPQRELLQVDASPPALLQRLGRLAQTATAPDDYSRT